MAIWYACIYMKYLHALVQCIYIECNAVIRVMSCSLMRHCQLICSAAVKYA